MTYVFVGNLCYLQRGDTLPVLQRATAGLAPQRDARGAETRGACHEHPLQRGVLPGRSSLAMYGPPWTWARTMMEVASRLCYGLAFKQSCGY